MHPVGRRGPGRGGDVEAGVGRQRQLDAGGGERAADELVARVGDGAAQPRRGGLLGGSVGVVGAGEVPVDGRGTAREAVEGGLDLRTHPVGLGRDVEAGEHELHAVAEAPDVVDRHLQLRRRRLALHAGDAYAVLAVLGELDAVEEHGGVGAEVPLGLDLVDELRGDGVEGDGSAGAGVLGDDRRSVGVQLGDGEPERLRPLLRGQRPEAREVAAGGVGAALDDVPGDHRAGDLVVGRPVGLPAVRGHARADHEAGIGDAAGDDHVGALPQGRRDAGASQVGVGGERSVEAEIGGARAQVVAGDVRDEGVEAEPPGDLDDLLGEAGGVEPAGVDDEAHLLLQQQAEAVLGLAEEGAGVAERGILHLVAPEDEHGQLGEVVAGEHVEGAALEHLAHRGEAVAVEAGAVADEEGLRHRRLRSAPARRREDRRRPARSAPRPRRRRRPHARRGRRGGGAASRAARSRGRSR